VQCTRVRALLLENELERQPQAQREHHYQVCDARWNGHQRHDASGGRGVEPSAGAGGRSTYPGGQRVKRASAAAQAAAGLGCSVAEAEAVGSVAEGGKTS